MKNLRIFRILLIILIGIGLVWWHNNASKIKLLKIINVKSLCISAQDCDMMIKRGILLESWNENPNKVVWQATVDGREGINHQLPTNTAEYVIGYIFTGDLQDSVRTVFNLTNEIQKTKRFYPWSTIIIAEDTLEEPASWMKAIYNSNEDSWF